MTDVTTLLAGIKTRALAYRDHGTPGLHAPQDRARLLAAPEAVLDACYASDDGTEWEHNDGCEGEPTCPACWAADIRAVLAAAVEAGQ